MRSAVTALLFFSIASFTYLAGESPTARAQIKKEKTEKETKTEDAPKKDVPEEKFDRKKSDLETLKAAGMEYDAKSLLQFFQRHTVSDADRERLTDLIKQFGDEDFDKRERATDEIEKFGIAAIGLLRQAERSTNPEILRRCDICLKHIEKIPTRTLAAASARLLADLKPEGTSEILLNYLPLVEDESVGDEIRHALAAVAMKDGKPDPILLRSLEDKNPLKRAAAAEAFVYGGDKTLRDDMRKLMEKDAELDLKFRVAMALVIAAKDKNAVESMIQYMGEVPIESGWRAEELLVRLAGEKGPSVSITGDKETREKARDEWLKWWKANEKDIDLAKLDDTERTLGYTLLIEMDIRGIGGRVMEIGPDGKKRWEITNVQFPTDAIVIPGNHVLVAEQNNNRVSERDIANGKEIWGETFNQPVGLQRLSTGNLVVIGRQHVVEWDRARKAVTKIERNQFDIVAGAKLRNGQFVVYTQQNQIVTYDKDGKQVGTFALSNRRGNNYNSTLQPLPNGKILVTQFQGVAEVDMNTKDSTKVLTYNFPTSAQRLPNGNILVANQNNYQVVEMDPKTNKTAWEYKAVDNNNFYRPWRAKRR